MAQTGYTPISIYYSSTASNTPTAGNLVAGELAINTADGKLFYKDSAGVVQVIGTKGGVGSSSTTQVLYNSSGLVVGSANMTFSGTALTLANDASISGLTVGKGGGSAANTTAIGYQAFNAVDTGSYSSAVGYQAGYSQTSGARNNYLGWRAGYANTSGTDNSFVGHNAGVANTTGVNSTAIGSGALYSNTTASNNTAVGYQAAYTSTTATGITSIGWSALKVNTADYSTAVGYSALLSNTTGTYNDAFGAGALQTNTTGLGNAAFSRNALISNTTGNNNSGFGSSALVNNTTGSQNTAVGVQTLNGNTTASRNTAVGFQAGLTNTVGTSNAFLGSYAGYYATGSGNTGVGDSALSTVTNPSTGGSNTACGNGALTYTSSGSYNAALGTQALYNNTTASNNTAVGYQAGYSTTTGAYNTFIGEGTGYANTTGTQNVYIGNYSSGSLTTTGSYNCIFGNYNGNSYSLDIRTASGYIVLSDGYGNPRGVFDNSGNFVVGGTSGGSWLGSNALNLASKSTTAGGQCLSLWNATDSGTRYFAYFGSTSSAFSNVGSITYNGTATLYNSTSDQRLKENIVDSGSGLDKLANIKIRAFDWIESKQHTDFGVIAQEINEVAPEVVSIGTDNEDGTIKNPWQVDTSTLVPAMIKAIQELNAKVTALEAKLGAK
jgi:hypothetical protein